MPRQPEERIYAKVPEEKLEILYAAGDQNAFWELWLRHEPELRRRALRYCFNNSEHAQEALDVAQDKLHADKWRSYDPQRSRWLAFASMVLRTTAIDLARQRARLGIIRMEPDDHQTNPAGKELEQLSRDLDDCLSQLMPKYLRLIVLVYYEGLNRSTAAAECGHEPCWATRGLDKAFQQLRACLTPKGY